MILFLDFDGVLHPFPMGRSDAHFSSAQYLWKILDRFQEFSVVITSTWREQHTFEELLTTLSAQGGQRYAKRFVGVTPVLETSYEYIPGIRQKEIETWLQQNDLANCPYLILDDIESYFDSNCRNLYLVDGATGLTEEDIESISFYVDELTRQSL